MVSYFANKAPELLLPRKPLLNQELWATKQSEIVFEPLGVVGIIKPWNYPLELPFWAIAPALVTGNTVVFKPSEHSSFVGLEIGKFFEEAGLPAGVLNIITGDGSAGKILVQHDFVNMISFTGSVSTGREIAVECAKRLRKCSLELGGNDAAIIEADVDLELASNGLVWGAFCNSGQVCVKAKRIFINEEILDELTEKIVEKTNSLRSGIDYGPIVSEKQLKMIESKIKDAVSKGAKILTGGRRVDGINGYFFLPTVMTNLDMTMNLMNEECFGPVLPIISVKDTTDAIERANHSIYGLGGSVWTSNLEKGVKIAKSIQAGMVWVNDVNVAFPETPWGGIKNSGLGVELSEFGIYEFVQPKHINIEISSNTRRDWWYPY
jgi:acyl-CoA reductase-like NAD-dependent aldehyde dehydrogenase